jgi:hypothetical protein
MLKNGVSDIMKTLVIPKPNPKQARFFMSRKRFIGYGGARGGGKSWALRVKFILLAFKYPGLKLLLLRKTLPELRENHIIPMMRMLYGIARYNKDERAFIFPNGIRIKLGYCDHENDIYQYQGQEYDVIGLEEATHFTWAQVQFLMTCNRSTRTDFKPRMYFTGNPGGVGHKWFKRLFVDKKYEKKEKPEDYDFIPATVDDNTVLMEANPEYVEILDNLPEKLRKAHRHGDWNVFEGQYFEEFTDDINHYQDRIGTHVIDPFEIPAEWKIYRSFDFGYAKPFSVGWWALDSDGRLYRILELYGCTGDPNVGVKWHPGKIAEKIREVEEQHRWLKGKKIIGIADPSIWDGSRGESVEDTMEKNRVYFDKGDNKRLPGWMQVHYRLAFDDNGIPMMYSFNTCKGFIRTMPELIYDVNDVEDVDTDGEDHIADETRYLCMSNPIAPRKTAVSKPTSYDPLSTGECKYDRYGFMKL